jgi:hypothetical protein
VLMRGALTAVACFAALLVMDVPGLAMVLVLAGPLADMLPPSVQAMAAIAGWRSWSYRCSWREECGNVARAGVSPHTRFPPMLTPLARGLHRIVTAAAERG